MESSSKVVVADRALQAATVAEELGLGGRETITAAAFSAREALESQPTVSATATVDVRAELERLPRITFDVRETDAGTRREPAALDDADLVAITTLGEGGMGRVVLARQRSLARDVAVKTPREAAKPRELAALVHEARTAGGLEHPGIVPVHALAVDGRGRPLLVMKRIDGVDWATLLADPEHPRWAARMGAGEDWLAANIEILVRVCEALELAHDRGVIHRDIKPENVMVGSFGEVYLADWGIARAKNAEPEGFLVGTPAFMAPEMVRGEDVDERTDVFLLGATLHAVLTGEPRHPGRTVMEMVAAAARSAPHRYRDDVAPQLANLCNAATSRDRTRRPPGARAFKQELLSFVRHRSAVALCDAALASLRALEALLGVDGKPPENLAEAYRLAAEARFGLAQCLRSYPEYVPAREASERCLEVLIDLEIRQGHVESASAMLREIASPSASLVARLEEARSAAARAESERARLRGMERDLDPSIERGTRALVGVIIVVLATALTAVGVKRTEQLAVRGDWTLVAFAGTVLVVTLGAGVFFRKRLFTNAFNRSIAWMLVTVQVLMLVNRAIGAARELPVEVILMADTLIILNGVIIAALALLPRLAASAPVYAASLVIMFLVPEHAPLAFGVAGSCALIVLVWAVATGRRRLGG
jgi:eukaryotic-like serine/threonine-protein kinase